MRCLTLAHGLRKRGAECVFICREHPGNLIYLIKKRGFRVKTLQHSPAWQARDLASPYAVWLGADWQADAGQSKAVAGDAVMDWLIVDHYALDQRWEQKMREHTSRLMVIDDLANRPHDCDLLLDQNLGRTTEDYIGLLGQATEALLGPQYALLGSDFAELRPRSLSRRAHNPQIKRLLITMGGVDERNATGQVLDILKTCSSLPKLHITVVMGLHAPWLSRVQALGAEMPQFTEVLVGVTDMAQLMADSDLAIGAAGVTAWERCCLGLPSFILALADNQLSGANALQNAGAAIAIEAAGQLLDYFGTSFTIRLGKKKLAKMSQSAAALTDGQGCDRVAELIIRTANA